MTAAIQALRKKMRIVSRQLMRSGVSGDYASAFRGLGMDFHQLREYVPGDDVRHIHWYSLLKTQKLMTKQFIAAHDRNILLLIDVSASTQYGSGEQLRKETMLLAAAGLATIAQAGNDSVSACLFSDTVESWIAPTKHSRFMTQLIASVEAVKAVRKVTDVAGVLKRILHRIPRNTIVCVLSDWIVDMEACRSLLSVVRRRHDLIAVRCIDPCEARMPFKGLITLQDPESGQSRLVDSRGLSYWLKERLALQKKQLRSLKIGCLDIVVGRSVCEPLMHFFYRRARGVE